MARIRTIKPEFFTSESIGALSLHARLTFAGLWTYVDDRGRARDNPRAIRGALWPNDEETVTSADVNQFIEELVKHDMVCRYAAEGANYLHVINMKKHQSINRPSDSKLPPCPVHNAPSLAVKATPPALEGDSLSPHGGVTEDSRSAHGGLTPGSGMEREVERELEVEPADEPPERAAKPRSRATEAPDHFEITQGLAAWAAKNNLTAVATEAETERFLLHHRSKGNTFRNWNAAWQKWMSNAGEWRTTRASPSPQIPSPRESGAFANASNTLDFDEPL